MNRRMIENYYQYPISNIGNINMDEILSINDNLESNMRDAEILNHKRVLSAIRIQKCWRKRQERQSKKILSELLPQEIRDIIIEFSRYVPATNMSQPMASIDMEDMSSYFSILVSAMFEKISKLSETDEFGRIFVTDDFVYFNKVISNMANFMPSQEDICKYIEK